MLIFLLTLAVALPDLDPTELDRLQGTWQADDGTRLVIDGDGIRVRDGRNSFDATVTVRSGRLRIVDAISTIERPYRLDGRRLRLGDVDYRAKWPDSR